jgi:hypothetical protein
VAASDAPRRRIYLVRHGEANYLDASGRRLADPDTAGLGQGREQARAVAQWFCAMGVARFDRVITSDYRLHRPRGAVLDDMRLPGVQSQAWPALRELRVADGQHSGESVAEARARILPALEQLRGGRMGHRADRRARWSTKSSCPKHSRARMPRTGASNRATGPDQCPRHRPRARNGRCARSTSARIRPLIMRSRWRITLKK